MMTTYLETRIEFEQKLYRHSGALYLCYNNGVGEFYISEAYEDNSVLVSYGPNPWGLVEKSKGFSETTFSPEIIEFLIKEEKPTATLQSAISHAENFIAKRNAA